MVPIATIEKTHSNHLALIHSLTINDQGLKKLS
jgi:hypothetical protein